MIGKRKRDTVVAQRVPRELQAADDIASKELFRRHFEANFEPLSHASPSLPSPTPERGDSEDSITDASADWEGFSPESEISAPLVELIEHGNDDDRTSRMSRSAEFKGFMGSKVPRESRSMTSAARSGVPDEEGTTETLNLKHDLDLQRLLKESHLLDKTKLSANPGAQRHMVTELRLQSLGSDKALLEQSKMPLSHRQGIITKAAIRESLRRQEAKENGIVLERAAHSTALGRVKRDRGVDMPSVGRFRNGTLNLSRQDISRLQGSSHGRSKGSRRKR